MTGPTASLLLLWSLCTGDAPVVAGEEQPAAGPAQVEIANPAPVAGARFGLCTCTLDYDADGIEDLAVGAPGAGVVYVFFGPGYRERETLVPEEVQAGDQFGADIAAGPIDGEPGDELVIGAPMRSVGGEARAGAVFVATHGSEHAQPLPLEAGQGAALGTAVALGDFDGDGRGDVAAGAARADVGGEASGSVLVYSPHRETTLLLANPLGANKNGNYGHDLAVADGDGDGRDDLFVSAVGNRSSSGTPRSGQVYIHFGPLTGAGAEEADSAAPRRRPLFVEDPAPSPEDWSRFGMSISARDLNADGRADLLVGAPRKDGQGVKDAGVGFLFFGPGYAAEGHRTFVRPQAKPDDILGFRCLVVDVVGGPEPDAVLSSLARKNVQALIVWDGADLDAAPRVLERPRGGSHHYIQGLSRGARAAGGRELLILGDPDYSPKDGPDETGRVLLQRH